MARMTAAQRDAFLQRAQIASLITHDGDDLTGVAIWYEWTGQDALMFTTRGSGKIARLRADPRACLLIAEPAGVPEAWVSLDGAIAIEEQGGMELARRLAPRYYAPEKAATTLERWEKLADSWVVLRLAPTRIRSLAPGG